MVKTFICVFLGPQFFQKCWRQKVSAFSRLWQCIWALKISSIWKNWVYLKFDRKRFVITTLELKSAPKPIFEINCLFKYTNRYFLDKIIIFCQLKMNFSNLYVTAIEGKIFQMENAAKKQSSRSWPDYFNVWSKVQVHLKSSVANIFKIRKNHEKPIELLLFINNTTMNQVIMSKLWNYETWMSVGLNPEKYLTVHRVLHLKR